MIRPRLPSPFHSFQRNPRLLSPFVAINKRACLSTSVPSDSQRIELFRTYSLLVEITKDNNKMDAAPMEVDPVDDGPRHMAAPLPMTPTPTTTLPAENMSKEEEARHAIEMLRGDDVSARVAAASRLESVASVLGEERTRQVGFWQNEMDGWLLIFLLMFVSLIYVCSL